MNHTLLFVFYFLILLATYNGFSEGFPQVIADPNCIGPGVEYSGMLHMKAGERVSLGIVDFGGFIEVRNEPRFNQGLFPNHNWRGFLSAAASWPVVNMMQTQLYITGGLEHESSHATMGIVESTDQSYEMIYDNQYRKSLFNAVPAGVKLVMYDHIQQLVLRGVALWFFISKNTPEVAGLSTAQSGGFSLSGSYYYSVTNRFRCFLSFHNRYVFKGMKKVKSERYGDDGGNPELYEGRFRVINDINTVTATGGVAISLFQSRRVLNVYLRYLYGHFYGYVDSRDKRSMVSVGMLFTGL